MARFVDPTIIGDDKWNDLNDAAIQGFGQFLSDIEHDPNDSEHRIWASESVGDLYDGIRGNTYPNYDDDYIAAAYMVEYHLSHCALAYWAFSGFLNGMNRLPDALYVCDVGSGTGAGLVGLSLALSDFNQKPVLYFDSIEPSGVMRICGESFWKPFSKIRNNKYDIIGKTGLIRTLEQTPDKLPSLPDTTLCIVSGFHLSFPYDVTSIESSRVFQYSLNSIASAVSLAVPDHGLFTVNRNKMNSLERAVNEVGGWLSSVRENVPTDNQIYGRHAFFSKCATDFGFAPRYSRRGYYRRYIFPHDAVLLRTESMQVPQERTR